MRQTAMDVHLHSLLLFRLISFCLRLFFLPNTSTLEIYTLSLHDALPIYDEAERIYHELREEARGESLINPDRSEEHTSELQSHSDLVCRLLLEKKKYQRASRTGATRRLLKVDAKSISTERHAKERECSKE